MTTFNLENKNQKLVNLTKKELKKLSDNPFKYNRSTTKSHIKSMLHSVNKWGVLRNPIIGYVESSNTKYIADGQHLIKAIIDSKSINSLDCMEVTVENEKELIHLIADLNTSSKSWGYSEFLNSWLNHGRDHLPLDKYEAYYRVNKINESTSLSLALIVDILCKDSRKFKTGEAELSEPELATITYKTLDRLKKINCPAHQLYGAKAYIANAFKNDELKSDLLTQRIEYMMRCKDAFVPSNREQFKTYLFGLMNCKDTDEVRAYIYGKWVELNVIS